MHDLISLRDSAARFLSGFLDPARASHRLSDTLALRPSDQDYTRVFVESAAATARESYTRLWSNITPIEGKPSQTVVLAWVCLSQNFSGPDGERFPGGYQKVADRFVADVPWIAWKFVAPGQVHGMAYDGLVRLDDRWVWFPKPWKLIGPSTAGLDYMTD